MKRKIWCLVATIVTKCATQIASSHHFTREHKTGGQKFKIKSENNERYCRLCYKWYKDPRYLRKHIQNIHSSELNAFDLELNAEDNKEAGVNAR